MLTPGGAERLRFGPFELDTVTGELVRAGVALKLQPQPFRLLRLFVSRPGELVTREEIREALWNDGTTVEFDQSLNYCIRQIRAALGEDAHEPMFIETLPKRGYRFIAPVTPVQAGASQGTVAEPEPTTSPRKPNRWAVWWIAIAAAAATVFLFSWAYRAGQMRGSPKAILVRPFVNLGLPAEDAWFSDALTQQLIGALAEAKTVRVVPWSSSLALKGQTANVGDLGKRFQVDAILEGSVGRSGDRLRIGTQLVDVATERTLWSHQDERSARDLANAQDDIMSAIAGTLKLRLAEAEIPAARRRPRDLETYNLYLKAVLLGDQFSREGLPESVKDFEEVIRRSPGYAPAYAGLANALAILPFMQQAQAKQMLARAREAAEQAIALDPTLALAHAALAHSLFNSWDWKRSEAEFQTALSLDPDSAMARHLYGLLLASRRRGDEALREARRAVDLAPTSALVSFSLAQILLHTGNYDEAIVQSRRTLELDRGFFQGYTSLARAYMMKGMNSEALLTLNEWERRNPGPIIALWRALLMAKSGQREQALEMIEQWIATSPRAGLPPPTLAMALLSAKEKDRALDAIEQGVRTHVPGMIWLISAPELAEIRSEPRFQAAAAMMSAN